MTGDIVVMDELINDGRRYTHERYDTEPEASVACSVFDCCMRILRMTEGAGRGSIRLRR